MSHLKIIKREDQMVDPKYRRFTEDEIKELKRGIGNWSDRMKEESNFLYKLKYSLGTITPTFIEAVIGSLEASGDFEITSFGHSKFILFIGGNQPPLKKGIEWKMPYDPIIDVQRKKALQRLQHKYFQVLKSDGVSYRLSKSGKQWFLSESQQNTFTVTLKPRLDLALLHEIISSEGTLLDVPPTGIRKVPLKKTRMLD